jgi:predicted nucleic acid-binding protein
MICVDTTFLIDLWRERDLVNANTKKLLALHAGDEVAVPAHAAGEFLEGGANLSDERFKQSLIFLRMFRIGEIGLETARHYAMIVAQLRKSIKLQGMSKPDLWIAAWAVEHGAPLATRNIRHFEPVTGLQILSYDSL